ncbi:MAG: transcriptional regulator [Pelagibacterales bacterium]|nr:transcriptional regulator [Pelagibacterales bacterium]|tara:strand:+ start:4491 stop:5000 length:510 start_codon:yes stop_codon:yes gene_type:complete
MLETLITSKTRLRLLIKFFVSQANHGYLNGLANEMGESTNSIRKELNRLFDAGYLQKVKINNKIEYKANINHPMFDTLQKVVRKHLGIQDMIETILEKMGKIEKIILIGDYANGIDSGNIETVLVGENLNMEYIISIQEKVEKLVNRKISFYLTSKFLGKKPYIILYEE